MFEIITIDELLKMLNSYNHKELHVHHTWSPSKANFNGNNGIALQNGMKSYHLSLGWSDIGQHVTLLPDGKFVTGRPFDQTPASIAGYNTGGFAMEMLGNFDIGHDVFEGAQKQSALKLAKYFIDKGRYVRFHRENSPKTCPGTSIDKAVFMAEAKGVPAVVNKVVTAAGAVSVITYPTGGKYNPYILDIQRIINKMGIAVLDEDGKCGDLTIKALEKIVVKRGDKNILVGWVQKMLNVKADNSYGQSPYHETYDAIIAYQTKKGLTVDGIVGKNTILKMCGYN